MSSVACIYFEGNDSKIALFRKEDGILKLVKGDSLDTSLAFADKKSEMKNQEAAKKNELFGIDIISDDVSSFNRSYLQKLNEFFVGEDISKCKFIPIITEPAVYHQKIRDSKDLAHLNITPNGKIDTIIDFVDLADGNKLAVYPTGQSNYLVAIDSLARMNNKKYLKIESVKCAEISLAAFIAKRIQTKTDEISLVTYVGKEYSKIIFLKGNRLHHIGSTLPVGKNSFNSHRVLVSKILLEMEHAGVNNVRRFIITGEDDSEDLKLKIKETFSDAAISFFKVKDIDVGNLDSFNPISNFIIPIAAAEEYFDQIENNTKGINLLPSYVKDQQKPFHLGWHGYLLLILTLLSLGYFSYTMYSNSVLSQMMQKDINRLVVIQQQNREVVETIRSYENKIQNVGQTKIVLDQLSAGTGILSHQMSKLSSFTKDKENVWIRHLSFKNQSNLKLEGYTLDRTVARKLSDSYNTALLESVTFDPIRDTRYFKFSIASASLEKGRSENASEN
jgi:hypothetical protein